MYSAASFSFAVPVSRGPMGVIWGASAGPLSETHGYSAVTAPVFDADEALDTMHDLSETLAATAADINENFIIIPPLINTSSLSIEEH
jgi:hypothetical protein